MKRKTLHTERSTANNKPKPRGNRSMKSILLTIITLAAVLWAGAADAATATWNTPGSSGDWNDGANWTGGTGAGGIPGATDDVVIDGETGSGSVVTLNTAPSIASVTISVGDTLRKDNSATNRDLGPSGSSILLNNAGTIVHDQGSGRLVLNFSTTGCANSGAIRADGSGREMRFGLNNALSLNNTGGLIEALNGGMISFNKSGTLTGGALKSDSTSTNKVLSNGTYTFANVSVTNDGAFVWDHSSNGLDLYFTTSGGLTNSGTATFILSGTANSRNRVEFRSGTTLDNSGTLTVETIKSVGTGDAYVEIQSGAAFSNSGTLNILNNRTGGSGDAHVDIKAGATFTNSGTIVIAGDGTYGTSQLRSAIDLTNAGTLIVDGLGSSIQMAGRTLTQTAGLLSVLNGGTITAGTVAIQGGTLAGNGTITGNATLGSGVTRGWSYADGVAGGMTVSGTLTLPATATVTVNGSGDFPDPAVLFSATTLAGAPSLEGWTVIGASGYSAKIDGNSVILVKPQGTVIKISLKHQSLRFGPKHSGVFVSSHPTTLGVYRWDAYHGGDGIIYRTVQECLRPERFRDKIPFFGSVRPDGTVDVDGTDVPEKMDAEIRYAAEGGVDYWIFLRYNDLSKCREMNKAWEVYRNSPTKPAVRFCWMLSHSVKTPDPEIWQDEKQKTVEAMLDPQWMRVLGDRPLLYVYSDCDLTILRSRLDEIRSLVQARGAANPYIVAIDFDALAHGCDAQTQWTRNVGQGEPASAYSEQVHRQNLELLAGRAPAVLAAHVNWDSRPYHNHPPPWWKEVPDTWFQMPTGDEYRERVQQAVRLSQQYPAQCEANTLFVYAWNEFTEGGILCPTRRADGAIDASLLDGLARVDKRNGETQP